MSLLHVEEYRKAEHATFGKPIRSLIRPVIPIRSKTEPNTIRRRRKSPSLIFLKSFTYSVLSRVYRIPPTSTLASMPAEILACIFQYLAQPDLHALMLTNSYFLEIAASRMYFQPFFASTYRYAQFARTVSHKEHYAEMVRVLDLSYFGAGAGEHWGLEPQAGWREFKCRYHNTSYVGGRKYARAQVSSHPAPSPLLKGFRRMRDIPVGGICHVLGACKRIRYALPYSYVTRLSGYRSHESITSRG